MHHRKSGCPDDDDGWMDRRIDGRMMNMMMVRTMVKTGGVPATFVLSLLMTDDGGDDHDNGDPPCEVPAWCRVRHC